MNAAHGHREIVIILNNDFYLTFGVLRSTSKSSEEYV